MAALMKRHPLQGVWTVIRFNWHLHAIASLTILVLAAAAWLLHGPASMLMTALAAGAALSVMASLFATWLAYDASGLYQMAWLAPLIGHPCHAANIHAGFDETTALLQAGFPCCEWTVFDFYQAAKHTEISIRRARTAHPPSPDTMAIDTDRIPLASATLDCAVMFLAAHEIRDSHERVGFFREINRVLLDNGRVIVTEHLRDIANIAAYSIGAWHFHTRSEWLATFQAAGFRVEREFRNNPLITTFVLTRDESAH
jgi:SAM-dependent methyltransferase